MSGTLYVVATPIGNLEDVTLRALRVLKEVDWIACEDTRRTRKLLSRHGIEGRLLSYHKFNERARARVLLEHLANDEDVALVSDGGTPVLSDPGAILIAEAAAAGHRVVPVPGPSALAAVVSAAGLPAERLTFTGFLPSRAAHRRRALAALRDVPGLVVFLESPRRAAATLRDLAELWGERRAVLEFSAEPRLIIAYHIPALSHPDEPALALLGAVLGGHGTATAWESNLMEYPTAPRWSRLYRRLVEGRGVAQEVMLGGHPGDRYPRLLLLAAAPRAPHTLEELEAAVLEEIDRMVSDPVGADELERARRNLRALYLRQFESYIGTAWMIGFTQGVTGDWRSLERFMDDLQRVRPEDVQRVARAYLSERNRTVVRLVEEEEREEKPGEQAGEPGAALPPGAADAREAVAP